MRWIVLGSILFIQLVVVPALPVLFVTAELWCLDRVLCWVAIPVVSASLWAKAGVGAVCCARMVLAARRFRRSLPVAQAWPHALRRAAIRAGVAERLLLVADEAGRAFTYGLIRPRIVITTGMVGALSPAELEAVLYHEKSHLVSADPARLLVIRTTRAMVSYCRPLARWLDSCLVAIELRADRDAISACGTRPVAGAMLAVLHGGGAGTPVAMAAFSGATDALDHRLVQLETGVAPQRVRFSAYQRAVGLTAFSALLHVLIALTVLCP